MNNLRAVITRHGEPEVLSLIEEPLPQPQRGQVRLAVRAVGVAFAYLYMRRVIYPGAPPPPFTPGFDVVGVVDAIGPEVRSVELGTRVGAIIERGASALYVCVDAAQLLSIPPAVPDDMAVAALLNYVTALQMLSRVARVQAGQAVFVHALAGGIGTAVLDLARVLGVRVVGTASAAKHAFVRERGGDPIDYRAHDFVREGLAREAAGYAAVLDGIGGAQLNRSHRLVARDGTLVSFGFQSANSLPAVIRSVLRAQWLALYPGRRTRVYVLMSFNRDNMPRLRDDSAWLLDRIARGELSPTLAAVLPLRDIARAHTMLETGQALGKIVLRPDERPSAGALN
jgi:NADPH:quinone reductase-like Zn-dependent oxidoreductase